MLYLAGQQASGVQALFSLQCNAKYNDLPLAILEPVIPVNEFKAMPPMKLTATTNTPLSDGFMNHSVIKFSDVFDLYYFNMVSNQINYAQLITRDLFFVTAPQKIVLVNIREG